MKKNLGKILIIVIPIIAVLLLLLPTYRAYELEKKHNEILELAAKAPNPADSLDIIEKFDKQYGDAFNSAKASRLKLGLDLRGGMYVTLEVDVAKLIEESIQKDAVDDIITEVLDKTKQEANTSREEDVIDIFKKYFDEDAKPKRKYLSDYFDFGDQGDISQLDDKIIKHLKDDESNAIDQAIEVMRQRIDKFGIAEPTIQKQGARRIMLELPGVSNESEMRQLIQTTARLEFKLVKNDENIVKSFYAIDKLLAKQAKFGKGVTSDSTKVDSTNVAAKGETAAKDTTKAQSDTSKVAKDSAAKADTANPYAGLGEDEQRKRYQEDHPFTTLFETYFIPEGKNQRQQQVNYAVNNFPAGDYSFSIFDAALRKFNEILSRKEVANLLPDGVQILRDAKAKPIKDPKTSKEYKLYSFYGLKKEPALTGEYITDAQASFDPQTNAPIVLMSMNSEGSEKWANVTGANIKKRIAIVLDDMVYSAPVVQNKIAGGSSQITGMDSPEEAKLLKIVLKAGALKAPVHIIEERIVGPSLGEDSINDGLTAMAIASLLVVFFMLIYYSKGGLVADFSVILNVAIVVAVLAAFQGTLSLPGIAGLILTIGMAVDTNVLIYERIREELRKGRSLRSAIDEGFSKAFTAIIDTHVTTFITGLILYFFGTGPIQGFALTLMIGLISTLFTQYVVSRAMIHLIISRGATHFGFGQPRLVNESDKGI